MIVDCHSDILIDVGKHWLAGRRGRLLEHHIPKMRAGGVTGAWCPLSVDNPSHDGDPYVRMLQTLEAVHDEAELAASDVAIVTDAASFEAVMRSGRIALYLGIEGAMPLAGRPERVEELHSRGLRWFGLTWNARNEVGDGLGVDDAKSLSAAGREIVAEMERLGVVIDLTHASIPLFDSVVDATTVPFAVTHSNSIELCDHVRNLTDEQLHAVRDRGGFVGVNFFPSLLISEQRQPTLLDIVAHADYLRRILGPAQVALAADFIDYDQEAMAAGLAASAIDYGDSVVYPVSVETTAGMENVLTALQESGWSEQDITGIAWSNQLDFIRRVESATRR